MDESLLDEVADRLRAADAAAALTGAGVSTASGIPSFRGEDGVWNGAFDPADFHRDRFERDPAGFWADRVDLQERLLPDDVEPNAAHEALARLEAAGVLDGVVTQNTDGLHQAAGAESVVEVHGNARRVACQTCGARRDAEPVFERARNGDRPPTCEDCGGVYKPDVVLFGEALDRDTLSTARDLASRSEAFLAVGSSLQVEPAASLPTEAARGGYLCIVNYDETPKDPWADALVRADVTEVLPAIADRVLADRETAED